MGFLGGLIGFVISLLTFSVLGLAFLPTLVPAITFLMLVFCACVVGVTVARALAPLLGSVRAASLELSRIAALVAAVAIVGLIVTAWEPVTHVATAFAVSQIFTPVGRAWLLIGFLLGIVGLIVGLAAQIVLTGTAYIVAALTSSSGASPVENEARGACAGVNAAANLLFGAAIMPIYLVYAFGWLTGGVLAFAAMAGIVVASIVPFTRDPRSGIVPPVGRTLAGWLCCLLPTAWFIELIALTVFLITLVAHATIGLLIPSATIASFELRSDTGSIVVTGGLGGNLNPAPMYNLGSFTFIRNVPSVIPIYDDSQFVGFEASVLNHEIGHQLNLAAFGSAFNLVGFVDEWLGSLLLANGDVYGERLASTNDPSRQPLFRTNLNMWVI